MKKTTHLHLRVYFFIVKQIFQLHFCAKCFRVLFSLKCVSFVQQLSACGCSGGGNRRHAAHLAFIFKRTIANLCLKKKFYVAKKSLIKCLFFYLYTTVYQWERESSRVAFFLCSFCKNLFTSAVVCCIHYSAVTLHVQAIQ